MIIVPIFLLSLCLMQLTLKIKERIQHKVQELQLPVERCDELEELKYTQPMNMLMLP